MRRTMAWWRLLFVGAVLGGVGLVGGAAEARETIEITPACPTTIAATGGPLNITLTLRNRTNIARTIATSAVAVHLGNLNLLGPFIVPLARTLSPFQTVVVPYLATQFPAGLASPGTLLSFGVMALDTANERMGGGQCLIRVP